jgi:hypothetical protein
MRLLGFSPQEERSEGRCRVECWGCIWSGAKYAGLVGKWKSLTSCETWFPFLIFWRFPIFPENSPYSQDSNDSQICFENFPWVTYYVGVLLHQMKLWAPC